MESPPEIPAKTPNELADPSVDHAPVESPRAKKTKIYLTPAMKVDPISRKLILLSVIFATLACVCIGFLTSSYLAKKHAHSAASTEKVSTVESIVITQSLDEIQVVLKNEQDLRVEMVAECSQKETCLFLKEHAPQARDLLIPVLTSINSQELSNIESKDLIRKKLSDRLNTLEMPGKVIKIQFVNLSVEGTPK